MSNKKSVIMRFNQQVPDPTLPTIFHNRGQSWVNYGTLNDYPNELITPLFNGSAMNKTCILAKHLYTCGEGLVTKNPEMEYILKRANSHKEGWNEVFSRAALDYIIYGGYALNIIWSEDGTKITDIYNMCFNDIRSGQIDKDTDRVEWYYYSADWTKYKKDLYRPKAVKAYDPNQADLYPNQILYFFPPQPGSKLYPVPSYSGALTAIQVDISIDSFHYYNLQNGLNPSLFVQMNNGIPSPEERQDIYEDLASTFSGVEGAGKFFLSFANDKEHSTEVTTIESANDDYYIALSQRIAQQILSAHQITNPLLLGIKDIGGSGLSNNKDELMTSAMLFTSTTIVPIQKTLLKEFNKLMSWYGYEEDLLIDPLRLFDSDGSEVEQEDVEEKA